MKAEMSAVYAEALRDAVDTAGHGLMDWEAFAQDCTRRGDGESATLARALAHFAEVTAHVRSAYRETVMS